MSIPNQEILTSMLLDFQTRVKPAASLILPFAKNTLYILITIDLALAYIMSLIKEEDSGYKLLLVNSLKYGAFILLVNSYSTIVNQIISSFQKIGLKAAGDTLTIADFTNPSKISDMGIQLTANLWTNAGTHEGWIMNPVSAFMLTVAGLAIVIAFYIIAVQIFIVTLEFAIVAALGLILVPFGVFTHTKFIFEKIKEGIISFGIKYMVLAFVVSISMKMVSDWSSLDAAVTWQQALYMAFGSMALAYLCTHAPAVASGMSSGGGGSLGGLAMAGAMAGAFQKSTGPVGTGEKKHEEKHHDKDGNYTGSTHRVTPGSGIYGLAEKAVKAPLKAMKKTNSTPSGVAPLATATTAQTFSSPTDPQTPASPTMSDSSSSIPDATASQTTGTSQNITSQGAAGIQTPANLSGVSNSAANAIPQTQAFKGPEGPPAIPEKGQSTGLNSAGATFSSPDTIDASKTIQGAGPSALNTDPEISANNPEAQIKSDSPKYSSKYDAQPLDTASKINTTGIDTETNQQKLDELRKTLRNKPKSGIHDPDKYK